MSGNHFTGGKLQHEPVRYLSDELMSDVERNVVYACTDVVLRDPTTGKLFLGTRQTEPQLGPWLIGGRDRYGMGPGENASIQVKQDLGIDVNPYKFAFVGEYSTVFPSASADRQDHGRHTKNSVMLLDMTPEQIELLNSKVESGDIRDEYSSGAWYDPSEIAKSGSDFPDLLKQLVRDLHSYDRAYAAMWDEAHAENTARRFIGSPAEIERQNKEQIERLASQFSLTAEEAVRMFDQAGPNAAYSIMWANTEYQSTADSSTDLYNVISDIVNTEEYIGDFNAKKILRENGITAPEVVSDNGPALKAILRGALAAIEINQSHDGQIFKQLKRLTYLGRSGIGPIDL